MLRDRSLIPLSHQHQHSLALYVRLESALSAGAVDLDAWQQEIELHYKQEIRFHLAAEEKVLFPAANHFPELDLLVEDLRGEHQRLRECFERAAERKMIASELSGFARLLSGHIRKEERKLFEAMQTLMRPEGLQKIGAELEHELAAASRACVLPKASPPR